MRRSEWLPPEIILVPAPAVADLRGANWSLIVIAVFILVALIDYLIVFKAETSGRKSFPDWFMLTLKCLFICSIPLLMLGAAAAYGQRRKIVKRLEAAQAQDEAPLANGVAARLTGIWKATRRCPKLKQVYDALSAFSPSPNTCGRIVVLGNVEVPEVGALFFEPFIVTPSERVQHRLGLVAGGAVIAVIGMARFLGATHPIFRLFQLQGAMMLSLGIMILAWSLLRRPSYLRLAPGVIEVLRFPTFGKAPREVLRFPIDADFAAVVRSGFTFQRDSSTKPRSETLVNQLTNMRANNVRITWRHGRHERALSLIRCSQPLKVLDAFWKAMLSTAVAPPMNPNELTG